MYLFPTPAPQAVRLYLDESGTLGFGGEVFTMAMVRVCDLAKLEGSIARHKVTQAEIKASQMKTTQKLALAKTLLEENDLEVYLLTIDPAAAYACERKLDKELLYDSMIAQAMAWYLQRGEMPTGCAYRLSLDMRGGIRESFEDMVCESIGGVLMHREEPLIADLQIRYMDSKYSAGVQVADLFSNIYRTALSQADSPCNEFLRKGRADGIVHVGFSFGLTELADQMSQIAAELRARVEYEAAHDIVSDFRTLPTGAEVIPAPEGLAEKGTRDAQTGDAAQGQDTPTELALLQAGVTTEQAEEPESELQTKRTRRPGRKTQSETAEPKAPAGDGQDLADEAGASAQAAAPTGETQPAEEAQAARPLSRSARRRRSRAARKATGEAQTEAAGEQPEKARATDIVETTAETPTHASVEQDSGPQAPEPLDEPTASDEPAEAQPAAHTARERRQKAARKTARGTKKAHGAEDATQPKEAEAGAADSTAQPGEAEARKAKDNAVEAAAAPVEAEPEAPLAEAKPKPARRTRSTRSKKAADAQGADTAQTAPEGAPTSDPQAQPADAQAQAEPAAKPKPRRTRTRKTAPKAAQTQPDEPKTQAQAASAPSAE